MSPNRSLLKKTLLISSACRGVAVLMVIVVLAGLMALATPFVFSMIQHSRAARNDLHEVYAREGADAAVAHALAQLHKTLRYDPTDTSPEVTSLRDLKIEMDFPLAGQAFNDLEVNVQNSTGQLWSARVEDEQGKININTAPPTLIGNLLGSTVLAEHASKGDASLQVEDTQMFASSGGWVCIGSDLLRYSRATGGLITLMGATQYSYPKGTLVYDGRARMIADYKFKNTGLAFSPFRSVLEIKAGISAAGGSLMSDEFARIERCLTTVSGMGTPFWGHAARVGEQVIVSNLRGFSIEKGDGFNIGSLIRVIQNGLPIKCGRVRAVTLRPDESAIIALEDEIGVSVSGAGVGNALYIQPELKHPLNINTASTQVLEAAVMGLCLQSGNDPMTWQASASLVEFLTRGGVVYTSDENFRKALDQAHQAGILTPGQRDAVYINATEPNSPKLRTSTVPFCYHSFGTYTIEGSGVSNSDNGLQLARNTIRQLVSLPTPWPGRYKVEYQAGMQGLLDQGLGNRVVTFPFAMGRFKLRKNAPNTLTAAAHTGDVRLDVGQSGPHVLPGEWVEHCDDLGDPGYRQDGYDLDKRGKAFELPPVTAAGQGNARPVATKPGSVEMWLKSYGAQQMVLYEEGLDEDRNRLTFSYEPSDGLVIKIYDAGLECGDKVPKGFTHLKRKPVEFLYPVKLDANEWYHIAGSWKSGTVNGQEIRLDAQPNPPANEQIKMKPGTKLSNDISLEEVDKIDLEEAAKEDFPSAGAVRIGEEIIEYAKHSGNSLTQLTRGARLSAIAEHKDGEWVTPYGFSNHLAQDLTVGGGTLGDRIAKQSETVTRVTLPPSAAKPYLLDSEVKKIPVDDATNFPSSGFLVVGGELIYYGKRTATSFETLIRAQHSAGVTAPARNIPNGTGIRLASLEVSTITDYDARGIVQIDDEDNGKLVEWIFHADKQDVNGKHYLLAALGNTGTGRISVGEPPISQNGNSLGLGSFRGYFGIRPQTAHAKSAKVIPVVRMNGPDCGGINSPFGDNGTSTVSVVSYGKNDGDLRYVKQAYTNQYANWHHTGPQGSCPAVFDNWGFDFYIGLNDFVSRRFLAGDSRLLKWPSGEFPDAPNTQRHICEDRNKGGMVHGIVDELIVNTFRTVGGRIAMSTEGKGVTAGDEEILVENFDAWPVNNDQNANLNWPTTGGLIRIGEELIFYQAAAPAQIEFYTDVFPPLKDKPPAQNKADRQWRNPCPPNASEHHPNIHKRMGMKLSRLKRGVLGTKADKHEVGAYIMLYDAMPISVLNGPVNSQADNFAVQSGVGFPLEGYAWMGDDAYGGEVLSWQRGGGGSFTGCQPFRGRFGTTATDHEVGEIVRCLPFRYWDREGRMYDGTGLAYIQSGYAAADAVWDSIELITKGTETQPEPTGVRPRLLVRFDGTPGWESEISNQDGGLYEFRGKTGIIPLSGSGSGQDKGGPSGIRADQIDLRIYWEFRSGCFMPRSSDWKRTFAVEKIRATYSSPLIMRRLDEIEKR